MVSFDLGRIVNKLSYFFSNYTRGSVMKNKLDFFRKTRLWNWSDHPENDYIPGGEIYRFIGSRIMFTTKLEGSHDSNLFR